MGKKLLIFVLIAVIVFSFSSVTYAAEVLPAAEDSKLVSDEIVSQIDPTGAGTVFRIYNTPIYYVFAHHDNIDSVLACREMLSEYYALKINDEYTYWIDNDGKYIPLNAATENARAMEVFETGEVIRYIGTDVIVYNTYYLSGQSTHTGAAIYYRTNKGDYVFFKHYDVGEKLFPVEAFCAFLKAVLSDEKNDFSPDKVGTPDLSQIWDLSPYDFRSDTFNLNALIPGSEGSGQENEDNPIPPEPPKEDVDAPVIPDPPKEDVEDRVIPESPKEDADDPVIPDPPKEDVDEPVIPDPPKEEMDDPMIPDPPKEDVDDSVIPDLLEEEVNDQVTLEPPEENVTEPVAPAPSEKSPVKTGEAKNSENNNADKTRALVLAVIDACLLLAGAVAAIICWRKGMMR
jgi:hypothetical protein